MYPFHSLLLNTYKTYFRILVKSYSFWCCFSKSLYCLFEFSKFFNIFSLCVIVTGYSPIGDCANSNGQQKQIEYTLDGFGNRKPAPRKKGEVMTGAGTPYCVLYTVYTPPARKFCNWVSTDLGTEVLRLSGLSSGGHS